MRFKTTLDTNSVFYYGVILAFPIVFSSQAFAAENTLLGWVLAVLAATAFAFMLYDLFMSVYIFGEDHVLFKALIGREKIMFTQILEAHIEKDKQGREHLFLWIGRRFPHKVRVKNWQAFLDELRRLKPDLVVEKSGVRI